MMIKTEEKTYIIWRDKSAFVSCPICGQLSPIESLECSPTGNRKLTCKKCKKETEFGRVIG